MFYIFFEAIVIPMFLLIGVWGSRSRKIYASYQFFLYTLFGSFFVPICFLFIYFTNGSSTYDFFLQNYFYNTKSFYLRLFLFVGFSVKVPIIPFHIWLPEAHVEAPTPGSVILAGILLKLGTYAMLRFLLSNFVCIYEDLIFIILMVAIIGFTYSSMVS